MSLKRDLAREIRMLQEQVKLIELKRERSQAAILMALVEKEELNPSDVEYFRAFTAEVDVKRDQIKELSAQLEKLM